MASLALHGRLAFPQGTGTLATELGEEGVKEKRGLFGRKKS